MTKQRHPAAGARTVAGAATALAFVGLVSGFQYAAAAQVSAPTPSPSSPLENPTPVAPTVDPAAPAQPDPAPAPAPAAPAPAPVPAAPAPAPVPAPADPPPADGTSGGS